MSTPQLQAMSDWGDAMKTPQSHPPLEHPHSHDSESPNRTNGSHSGDTFTQFVPKPRCDHIPGKVKVQAETLFSLLYLSLLFPWEHFSTTAAQGLQVPHSSPLWGQTAFS